MPVKKTKLSVKESFVQTIEDKILSGEYEIGERLPTARELCAQMGVSLTVVNTGINELVSKGFVEVKPRHGTYVADYKRRGTPETLAASIRHNGGALSAHDVRSCLEARAALDSFVVRLAIERASDEQLGELRAYAQRVADSTGAAECCDSVMEFYSMLYYISDNSFMALVFAATVQPQKNIYAMYMDKNGMDDVKLSTAILYKHLLARDSAAAINDVQTAVYYALKGEKAIV